MESAIRLQQFKYFIASKLRRVFSAFGLVVVREKNFNLSRYGKSMPVSDEFLHIYSKIIMRDLFDTLDLCELRATDKNRAAAEENFCDALKLFFKFWSVGPSQNRGGMELFSILRVIGLIFIKKPDVVIESGVNRGILGYYINKVFGSHIELVGVDPSLANCLDPKCYSQLYESKFEDVEEIIGKYAQIRTLFVFDDHHSQLSRLKMVSAFKEPIVIFDDALPLYSMWGDGAPVIESARLMLQDEFQNSSDVELGKHCAWMYQGGHVEVPAEQICRARRLAEELRNEWRVALCPGTGVSLGLYDTGSQILAGKIYKAETEY